MCSTLSAFHVTSLPMKPDIKICGLKTAEAVDRAVALGATHVGFIFFEKSPRNIEPDIAGQLADRIRGRAKIVAVTVDADNDDLDEIIALLREIRDILRQSAPPAQAAPLPPMRRR